MSDQTTTATPDTTAPAPAAATPTVTPASPTSTPAPTSPVTTPAAKVPPANLHPQSPSSGSSSQIVAHIINLFQIKAFIESLPATLENAAKRLEVEAELAKTWYSGHRVLALCIGSFIGGASLVLIIEHIF